MSDPSETVTDPASSPAPQASPEAAPEAAAATPPSSADLVRGAVEGTAAGVASYNHGNRGVVRLDPMKQLDVADRYDARAARRSRGPFLRISQGGGF